MASSLTTLVNCLSEGIHKIKCKYGHDNKNWKTCGITYELCDYFFEYTNCKDDLIEYKCLCCNKMYERMFHGKLKERFLNTQKFSNHDNNKFLLLLQKVAFPNEYMDDWEKFNETLLPEKEGFYNHLNIGDINDADYAKAKRFCKDFEIKNLGEYHNLYV